MSPETSFYIDFQKTQGLQLYVSMTVKRTVDSLDLGGLTEHRPMETGLIWAPMVTGTDGDWLQIDPARKQKRKPTANLATIFADLADAENAAILKFAKKWGAISVGEDGWPGGQQDREPILGWRLLAQRYRGALNIGSAFNLEQPGTEADWYLLSAGEQRGYEVTKPWQMKHPHRDELQSFMRAALTRFRVGPRFWWNGEREQWQIDLDAQGRSNLPGLLLIQAMLIIADKEGFAICSSCHKSYMPKRKPDPTRRNYCDRCGKTAAWRDAARERRKREREEKGDV